MFQPNHSPPGSVTIHCRELKLPKVHLTLKGHSRGSERSGFYIPELSVCFDAGVDLHFNPRGGGIFISHCHGDHSYCLPMMIAGIRPPPLVCCPKEHVHLFENFVQAARLMVSGGRNSWKNTFCGVSPADEIPLPRPGNYVMRVFELFHSVPAVGYGLCQRRTKLKPEYVGKQGHELAALRLAGTEIEAVVSKPIIAYLTDTTTEVFVRQPELFAYPIVIVECTFLEDDLYDMAQESQHTHWRDLKPYIISHPDTHFVLVHFSLRYDAGDLDAFFSLDDNQLPNMSVWKN
jgi:ribonuclease Z